MWDKRFLELAKLVATWSKDPRTKVGCLIVDKDKIVRGLGYNGFPRGVRDTEHRLNDRELKNTLMVHAERNALDNCLSDVSDCTLYTTRQPCLECAKGIIQMGISKVIGYACSDPAYTDNYNQAIYILTEAGVITEIKDERGNIVESRPPKDRNPLQQEYIVTKENGWRDIQRVQAAESFLRESH